MRAIRGQPEQPIADSKIRRAPSRPPSDDELLLEQQILAEDRPHAAGAADLHDRDGQSQVQEDEQEVLHRRDSVRQNSGGTQYCLGPRFPERITNSRPTGTRDAQRHPASDI